MDALQNVPSKKHRPTSKEVGRCAFCEKSSNDYDTSESFMTTVPSIIAA